LELGEVVMKQKIYDIPIWDAYALENCECPLCVIEKNMEGSFMDILFDDMLMTPYFAQSLQSYRFCTGHFRKLYIYKDKLGLALMVNNFLQCEKEALEKGFNVEKRKPKFMSRIKGKLKPPKSAVFNKSIPCYLCEKIDLNLPDYLEVLVKLWNKNEDFKKLYELSKGHCFKHYNSLMEESKKYLNGKNLEKFIEVTHNLQKSNINRLIGELDWFATKFDYRFKDEPWKNSKDALPRCINKLVGDYYEEKE
jgi:hypothetical protein